MRRSLRTPLQSIRPIDIKLSAEGKSNMVYGAHTGTRPAVWADPVRLDREVA